MMKVSAYNIPRTTNPTPPSAAAAAIGMLVGAAIPSEVSVAEERAAAALLVALARSLVWPPAMAVTELRARLAEEAASPVAVASVSEREEAAASAEDCAA